MKFLHNLNLTQEIMTGTLPILTLLRNFLDPIPNRNDNEKTIKNV